MADVATSTAPAAGANKGVWRNVRENPYLFGLSAVSLTPTASLLSPNPG